MIIDALFEDALKVSKEIEENHKADVFVSAGALNCSVFEETYREINEIDGILGKLHNKEISTVMRTRPLSWNWVEPGLP